MAIEPEIVYDKHLVVNCETGEEEYVMLTAEEDAIRQTDKIAGQAAFLVEAERQSNIATELAKLSDKTWDELGSDQLKFLALKMGIDVTK